MREVLVPAAAGSAPRDDDACVGVREVGDQPAVVVEHLGADGNREDGVLAARAVRQPAAAGTAASRTHLLVRPNAGEVAPPRVGDEHDVTTVTAVATVGAALRNELLAPEVERSVPAAATLHPDAGAIVEHDGA